MGAKSTGIYKNMFKVRGNAVNLADMEKFSVELPQEVQCWNPRSLTEKQKMRVVTTEAFDNYWIPNSIIHSLIEDFDSRGFNEPKKYWVNDEHIMTIKPKEDSKYGSNEPINIK
jgi:hypothetical protein